MKQANEERMYEEDVKGGGNCGSLASKAIIEWEITNLRKWKKKQGSVGVCWVQTVQLATMCCIEVKM